MLNVVYSRESTVAPKVVISIDAEKAFDRVEWSYLFAILTKCGIGKNFISWVLLLYTLPCASIITNNKRSGYLFLNRGCRLGCPLSPLLFALAIEPLSIFLRTSPGVGGIIRGRAELKLSLYTDDLLFYVTDPLGTLSTIVKFFQRFGQFSGYKANVAKSECFPG